VDRDWEEDTLDTAVAPVGIGEGAGVAEASRAASSERATVPTSLSRVTRREMSSLAMAPRTFESALSEERELSLSEIFF
jgi:hypothetical protein